MRILSSSLISLLLGAAFFCAAPAFCAAELNPALSGLVDQRKAEASGLLKAGKYDQACEIYLRLLREAPDDADINMGLALAASGAKRHNLSIMAYERLIEMNPNIPGFYLGLGKAYVALGDENLGREYVDLARKLDPKATEADADAMFDRFKKEFSRFSFHGKLSGGFLYDSNANQGTVSNRMTLGAYDMLVPGAERIPSAAAYAAANFDFGMRLTEGGPLWLVADAAGYLKGNFNSELLDRNVRNLTWGRGAAGLRWLSDKTMLEAKFKIEGMDYDTFQNVSALGPETTLVFAVLPKLQLITRAGWEQRAYSIAPERDGSYYHVGEYLRLFFGNANHEALFGARYLAGLPRHEAFRYGGWEALFRLNFKLPWSLEFAPFVSWTREFYHGPATVMEEDKREDTRWSAGAGLTYRFTESVSLDLSYRFVGNQSNSELHTYDQHVVTTGLSWNF